MDTLGTTAYANQTLSEAPMPGVSPALKTSKIDEIEDMAFVLDHVEKATRYRQPFEPVWDEIRDNYCVVPFGTSPSSTLEALMGYATTGTATATIDGRSRLKDPETHQVIETITSQALLLLLGPLDYLRAIPYYNPDKARFIERLLMSYMAQPGEYRTHYQLIKNAFSYGTAYVEIGWQTLSRMQPVRRPATDMQSGLTIYDENGRPVQVTSQEEVIYRDCPLVTEIPIRQFYPDASGTRIHKDMYGVAKGFRVGKYMAEKLMDATTWNCREAVRRALNRLGKGGSVPQDRKQMEFPNLSTMPPDAYGLNAGFEFWGEVPFNRPGGRNRVIALWAGERVRAHPIPFIDGEIPIKEIVINPMGGRHYGISPAEVIRFLQDSTDNFLMLFNDAGDLAIRGPILMGQAFGGDPERLKASMLNDVIKCRNVDAVKPLERDMGALTFAAQEMARRILRIREAAGATNPLQAIPGPVEKTATETTELVRLASQRVQTMVELVERDDYPWIGRTIHSRFRQFGTQEMLAVLNNEAFEISLDDIDEDADVRFVGSGQAESAMQTAGKYEKAITVISAAPPEFVEQYPQLFVRYFRDGLKIQDAERWVAQAIQVAQMRQVLAQQQAMAAGQQGMTPSQEPQGKPASDESMGAANDAANAGEAQA